MSNIVTNKIKKTLKTGVENITSNTKFKIILPDKIKKAITIERDLEIGDIVDVYDYFFDVQTDNEIINDLYAKYIPKIGDLVEFKKGIVVEEEEDKKETKKKDEKKEEESSGDEEDEKKDTIEKSALVGSIISIYNSDKSKKASKDKQCDPSPGKDKCLFEIRDMSSNKLYNGIFAANIQPTLEHFLTSQEFEKIKADRDEANDEKRILERLKKLEKLEEINKGTIQSAKNIATTLGIGAKASSSAVGSTAKELGKEIGKGLVVNPTKAAYKKGKKLVKNVGKNLIKTKSLEKSVNQAAYDVAKDTAKEASDTVVSSIDKTLTAEQKKIIVDETSNIVDDQEKNTQKNLEIIKQSGGSKKEVIAKQMLKLHRMNSKTKKGIIIDKKTFDSIRKKLSNKFDNWRHMNIKGPYTVFIFENIASIDKKTNQDLLRLSIEEKDIEGSINKFDKIRQTGGMEKLKTFCVLTNLPTKAFKQKKKPIYQQRKEGDIVDVFFEKNDKVWKTIQKKLEELKKEIDKDGSKNNDNPYKNLLDKLSSDKQYKLYKFCQGRIGKIEKPGAGNSLIHDKLTLEVGVLRNIIKELGVKLIKDDKGELVKDLSGRTLKINDAFIGVSSKTIPLTPPTKSLYTFISDPDNTTIKADYKTPKDHITNYRKEGDNHWLEHTININDDGTFFEVLKEKDKPIIVTRKEKYNVESKDLEYRNYYGTRKTTKAIGFKKIYDPNETAENIKKYHPLNGDLEEIKEMFKDEIENKHEFLKFEKEIEKEEEERRKKEEEENAAVDSAENEMEGQKNEIEGQKNKIKELQQQITEKCGEKMKKDDEEQCEQWKKEKKKEEKIQDTMGFKLTSLKNKLSSLNKCGRRPKSWSDYQKKMGCDIKSISDSVSNMILKLIKPASEIIMKSFATLPGYENEWQQIYPVYVKAAKNKDKATPEEKMLVKIVNDLLDEVVAVIFKTSTYTVKNLERQVDPLLERINIFVETIIKGFYSFIADAKFFSYAQGKGVYSLVEGNYQATGANMLFVAVAVSRLLRNFLKKVDAVAGLEQRVFDMINQAFAIFPEVAGRIIQMINKVKILVNIGLIITQKNSAIITNEYEINLFEKYYSEMSEVVDVIEKMKGRKYGDEVWEREHEKLIELMKNADNAGDSPRNEEERKAAEKKAKEEAEKEKDFIKNVLEPREKEVKQWVKENTNKKTGGGDGDEQGDDEEEDDRKLCGLSCMIKKHGEKIGTEDIDAVVPYTAELKNEHKLEKLTKYDVNDRIEDVFAEDTLKQLGFINDILMYFIKDTVKIAAKDVIFNFKKGLKVQNKVLDKQIRDSGALKTGKKEFEELTKRLEEGLRRTFVEVSDSTGDLLKMSITKLMNEIIILLVTKICSKPFAFCFPALEKLQKKSPNTSWEKVKEDAQKIKRSIKNMYQPALEKPTIAGINLLIKNAETAMESSKLLGPKAIQHTVTKYMPQNVLKDPYFKIDKMMEKVTDEVKEPLQEFKGIYDKTPKTTDRFQVALDEFIAKKMGGDDE